MDANIAAGLPSLAMETNLPYVCELTGFEALYHREYPALHAVAAALTGMADSEDLVQDTMVRTLIHWQKVQRLERPGGWCHRVLLNICRGWWRRRQVESRYTKRYRHRDQWAEGPSADVVAFWDAVRRLPNRPRLAVALYYAADRSIGEVASILAVPEGTVKSDLARARVALASELRG